MTHGEGRNRTVKRSVDGVAQLPEPGPRSSDDISRSRVWARLGDLEEAYIDIATIQAAPALDIGLFTYLAAGPLGRAS